MAGHNHHRGMSNNAVDACRRNLKPVSRFATQDLRPHLRGLPQVVGHEATLAPS